jgi:hypothetical protein
MATFRSCRSGLAPKSPVIGSAGIDQLRPRPCVAVSFQSVLGSTTPREGGKADSSSGVRACVNGVSRVEDRAVWAPIRHSNTTAVL